MDYQKNFGSKKIKWDMYLNMHNFDFNIFVIVSGLLYVSTVQILNYIYSCYTYPSLSHHLNLLRVIAPSDLWSIGSFAQVSISDKVSYTVWQSLINLKV